MFKIFFNCITGIGLPKTNELVLSNLQTLSNYVQKKIQAPQPSKQCT